MKETNEEPVQNIVVRLSPRLSGKQRRYLRSLAHDLKPVVMVGHKGVSENLVENFEAALVAHELVKVKVHEGDDIENVASMLHKATDAQLAQKIGHILVFYRRHPKVPKIVLPKHT